jgi:hypothetical protein
MNDLTLRIAGWLDKHSGMKRVLRTWLFSFLGLLIPGLLGWLNALTEWARSEGQRPFPDATSLAYVGVVAISASSIALVNGLGIWLEDRTGKALLRGDGDGILKDV